MTGPLHPTRRGHLRSLLAAFPLRSRFCRFTPRLRRRRTGAIRQSCTRFPGCPRPNSTLQVQFAGARITPMRFRGTLGYVIEPTGRIDRERRWVWVSPMYLAIRSIPGGIRVQYYVESLASAGFHVVGLDVGASLRQPRGRGSF